MIKSMTGYGSFDLSIAEIDMSVEIKSVNNRYLDITTRLPKMLSHLEDKLTKTIKKHLSRGSISIIFRSQKDNGKTTQNQRLNEPQVEKYLNYIKKIQEKASFVENPDPVRILQLPDAIISGQTDEETKEKIDNAVLAAVENSLKQLISMQEQEGRALHEILKKYLAKIEPSLQKIKKLSSERRQDLCEEYREKIAKMIQGEIDENRILQEACILSEKLDISEECDRLESHIQQFELYLESDEAVGKRLTFLLQEMNREVNTIGSKANSLEISHLVVEMKNNLEILREQSQNVI